MTNTKFSPFVGSRQFEVKDDANGISFPVLVHYPTDQPSSPINFGPYTMEVSPDAEIIAGQLPLIIISHGNGGSNLLYRTISTFLARAGYIIAMPEHYGNNRSNNELENSIDNLRYRPKHVSLVIDYLLSNSIFKQSVDGSGGSLFSS